MIEIGSVPSKFDAGYGSRARIGLISLASDHTIEMELGRMTRGIDGLAVYTTRVWNEPTVTPESLRAMGPRLTDAASTLLPGVEFDVIAYACTSASLLIGHDAVEAAIQAAKPSAKVATTMAAVAAALHRRGAKKIAIVTPYVGEINPTMVRYLEEDGLNVVRAASFNQINDNDVGRLSAEAVFEAAKALGSGDDVDAIFISCTSIRAVDHVKEWEKALGKPVVSSNIALGEMCLALAGLDPALALRA